MLYLTRSLILLNPPNPHLTMIWVRLGSDPYLPTGNCIGILWQKMKCIRILVHKWIRMDSDQIAKINVFVFGGQKIKSIRFLCSLTVQLHFAVSWYLEMVSQNIVRSQTTLVSRKNMFQL